MSKSKQWKISKHIFLIIKSVSLSSFLVLGIVSINKFTIWFCSLAVHNIKIGQFHYAYDGHPRDKRRELLLKVFIEHYY